jgi:hypothetical protein
LAAVPKNREPSKRTAATIARCIESAGNVANF